jgi:hypothetical protein
VTASSTAPAASRPGGVRRAIAAVCLGLPALAVLAFGGQLLVLGWLDSRPGGIHHVHDLAWGAAEGILLFAAVMLTLVDTVRGRVRPAVRQQALAVLAALLTAMGLTATPDPATLAVTVLVLTGVFLAGPRSVLPSSRWALNRPLAVLALVAGLALVPYALVAAAHQRAGGSLQAERIGFTGATVWALAVVGVVAVAALGARGWQVPALSAAAAVTVLGVAGIVWPVVPSSLGLAGGLAALAWSVAVFFVVGRTPADRVGTATGSDQKSRAKAAPRSGISTRRMPGGAAPASSGTSATV